MFPSANKSQRLFRHSAAVHAGLILAGLIPILAMLVTVLRNWVPVPYWDEWTTPGATLVSYCTGTLTLAELFSQHNESRKFFPRLLYLGLAQFGGWDVRKEMSLVLSASAPSARFSTGSFAASPARPCAPL